MPDPGPVARAYANGDDVFLAWAFPRIENCWGFAIQRTNVGQVGAHDQTMIHNRVGFGGDDAKPGEHRPSTDWPFQRYTWTDHDVDEGQTVSYTIIPVVKTDTGLTHQIADGVTAGPVLVSADAGDKIRAYFNRGVLLSQFIARRLPPNFDAHDLENLKSELAQNDDQLRRFLMGQLGARLLRLLDDAKTNGWHVYAALYELEDAELVAKLQALGRNAHLVLSNGSKKKRGEDGNKTAADKLAGSIDLHRRMLWSEGLGHNKFLVLAHSESEPFAVWTGSTNWATTGLCTQLNNGLLVEDDGLAQVFLDQWKLLRDDSRAGRGGVAMHFGPALLQSNDTPKAGHAGTTDWTVWFTRTTTGHDMEAAAQLINEAEHAILFLMFEPGNSGLRQVVEARLSPASTTFEPNLYVRGVVNTLHPATHGKTVAVDLVRQDKADSFRLDVIEPEGVTDLAGWATEVTRKDFLENLGGSIGHAIIHSKVLILDPFTKPVVITGSHNFSHPASANNDENLVILRNARLAERYAVNVISNYQHYRWRAYLQDSARRHRKPWDHLVKSAKWQRSDAASNRDLAFWLR